jgi:hypothetical protein
MQFYQMQEATMVVVLAAVMELEYMIVLVVEELLIFVLLKEVLGLILHHYAVELWLQQVAVAVVDLGLTMLTLQ